MARLTDNGRAAIAQIARAHGVSEDAVASMAMAVARGGGTMAQFSHPEFGGSGQWMRGGMTMVSDMFNHGLKMTVDNVCEALSSAMASGKLLETEPGDPGHVWWPDGLGHASTVGGQGNLLYAVFPDARRVLVNRGGRIERYDLGEHQVGGVSQQQDGGGMRLSFSSQLGQFDLSSLRRIDEGGTEPVAVAAQARPGGGFAATEQGAVAIGGGESAPPVPPPAVAERPAPQSESAVPHRADPLEALERLALLVEKGLITREEFDAKKADLLARI